MSEWDDWCRMREVVQCSEQGCSSCAYPDTGKCASHSQVKDHGTINLMQKRAPTFDQPIVTLHGPPISNDLRNFMSMMLNVPPESVTGIMIAEPHKFTVQAGGVNYDFGVFTVRTI